VLFLPFPQKTQKSGQSVTVTIHYGEQKPTIQNHQVASDWALSLVDTEQLPRFLPRKFSAVWAVESYGDLPGGSTLFFLATEM